MNCLYTLAGFVDNKRDGFMERSVTSGEYNDLDIMTTRSANVKHSQEVLAVGNRGQGVRATGRPPGRGLGDDDGGDRHHPARHLRLLLRQQRLLDPPHRLLLHPRLRRHVSG